MSTITIRREDLDLFTLHDVMKAIKDAGVSLTLEQEFRVTAMIKRHVHYEKADVYSKIQWWIKWKVPVDSVMQDLAEKVNTHSTMAKLPDEQIVTWDVGTHVYKPGEPK